MPVLLQVDFPFSGPWGDEMSIALKGLAESIAQEPGLIWKIWTENPATAEAGGIYLFADRASAEAYLAMHTPRLKGFANDMRGGFPLGREIGGQNDLFDPSIQRAVK